MTGPVWVVGAGGIGGGIAARLATAGVEVVVLDGWAVHVTRMRAAGLVLDRPGGRLHVHPPALHLDDPASVRAAAAPGLVLLAVKSDRTRKTLGSLAAHLPTDCPVLSLQNGLNEDTIAQVVGADRTIGAVVRFDGELIGPGHVRAHRDDGDLVIGAMTRSRPALQAVERAADLLRAALPVVVSADIRVELWSKLTRNCLLNAVSTLVGMGLGRMAALPEVRTTCLRTGLEVVAVARAQGVPIEPGILYGADLDGLSAGDPTATAAFHAGFERTYAHLPDLKPSMLQDAEKGRAVEVRSLNGAVVEAGAQVGVAAPCNDALTERVEELVRGERTPGVHNLEELT